MGSVSKCCLFNRAFVGFGNNPEPIKESGRCCDECNYSKVIPARLKLILAQEVLSKEKGY